MATTIEELLVGLGFDYDPKDLKKYKDDIKTTVDITKKLVASTVAAAAAITGLTVASTAASDVQGKLADKIGVSVEDIDALDFAVKRAGARTSDMVGSLTSLTRVAAEAARGVGGGIEAFGMLDISVRDANGEMKDTLPLLLEVSKSLQGLDKGRQADLAGKLGVGDSILLLQQGPEAIRELIAEAKQLGVTTAKDAKAAADFQDSLVDIWVIIKQISRTIAGVFAPAMTEANNQIAEWWKTNKALIEQNMPKWIENASQAIKVLTVAMGALIAVRVLTHIGALIGMMRSLSLATLAMNASALLLPTLIAAGVVALGLLAEDARVFLEGGDSFIGDMIEKFPEWTTGLTDAATILGELAAFTLTILDGWNQIFKLFTSKDISFKEAFTNIPGFIGDVTGLSTLEGEGPLGALRNAPVSSKNTTFIDRLNITIPGAGRAAEDIANAVYEVFQQATQDLSTPVEQ